MNYLVSGVAPTRLGNAHPNIVPYAAYPTADSWFILAVGNVSQFAKFCAIVGITPGAELLTNQGRLAHRAALTDMIRQATRRWLRDDLLSALEAAGVPAGPINTVAQALGDPHIVHRGMVLEMPDDDGRVVPGIRLPIRFSRSSLAPSHRAPARPRE